MMLYAPTTGKKKYDKYRNFRLLIMLILRPYFTCLFVKTDYYDKEICPLFDVRFVN